MSPDTQFLSDAAWRSGASGWIFDGRDVETETFVARAARATSGRILDGRDVETETFVARAARA